MMKKVLVSLGVAALFTFAACATDSTENRAEETVEEVEDEVEDIAEDVEEEVEEIEDTTTVGE